MDLTWFRAPAPGEPGRISLGYNALDRHVIGGRATDPALVRHDGTTLDFAGLLEQASALGGAFTALGVTDGSRVVIALADPGDELLAMVACARLAAVFVTVPPADLAEAVDHHRPVLVATSAPPLFGAHEPAACVVRGTPPLDPGRDLDWEMGVRAGRTQGSALVDRSPADAAYIVGEREVSVGEALEPSSPHGPTLATLVAGRPVDLRRVDA